MNIFNYADTYQSIKMAPTKLSKSKEQKEGAKFYEDHGLCAQGVEQRMITLNTVTQNELEDNTAYFDMF